MQVFADASHAPVEAGTYYDKSRERHERDRKAKWGTLREDQSPLKNVQRIPGQNIVPFEDTKLIRFSSESRANDRLAKICNRWKAEYRMALTVFPRKKEASTRAGY